MAFRPFPCRISRIALTAALIFVSTNAWADGPLSPAQANETLSTLRFKCALALLCPYAPEIWKTFREAMAREAPSQYLLGVYLITGDKVPRDERGGQQWFGIAALQGYAEAALELNRQRRNGAEMIVDEPAIATAMRTKADQNDPDAMRALSGMYLAGRGVDRDPAQAVALLRRAAGIGSGKAERDLANLLLDGGQGVPKDIPEALRLLASAGGRGDVDAMRSLSWLLLRASDRVKPKPMEAYRWLLRAALLGDAEAQQQLSQLLATGLDTEGRALWGPYDRMLNNQRAAVPELVPIDLVQADKWFRLAARDGWHDNPAMRQAIEPRMTSAQLAEAQKQVASWHKLTLAEVMALDIPPPAETPRP